MGGIRPEDVPGCPVKGCKQKGFIAVGTHFLCGTHVMSWHKWKRTKEKEMVEAFAKEIKK